MIAQLDRDFIATSPCRAVARLTSYLLFEGRPLLTRGQWINSSVLAHLRFATHLPLRDRVDRPVFILGMGRSGTTLLGRIFAAHPDVGFLNEPKALWHAIHPDEDIIGTYAAEPGTLRLAAEDATPSRIAAAHRILSWYLILTRSHRVVDKYPELIFRASFVRALFPDAIFVVLVRRGWDVVSSVQSWSAAHRDFQTDWWGLGSRKWRILWEQGVLGNEANTDLAAAVDPDTEDQIVRAAVEWTVTMRTALSLCATMGSGVCFVRYEDLTANPGDVAGQVLECCDLDRRQSVLDFADRAVHSAREPEPQSPRLSDGLSAAVEVTAKEMGYD
ncbi:MAG TPA: sulfotransferase [Acidimicrobiales bacterium]|jgi:hypothetical protein